MWEKKRAQSCAVGSCGEFRRHRRNRRTEDVDGEEECSLSPESLSTHELHDCDWNAVLSCTCSEGTMKTQMQETLKPWDKTESAACKTRCSWRCSVFYIPWQPAFSIFLLPLMIILEDCLSIISLFLYWCYILAGVSGLYFWPRTQFCLLLKASLL